MSGDQGLNQDEEETCEYLPTRRVNFISQAESNSPVQMPIRPTGLYPSWLPNSTTQFQQHQISPQFAYNQPYQNMSYFHQHVPPPPYTNMAFFQQPTQSPQLSHTQPFVDSEAHRHDIPSTRSEASQRNNRNWTPMEDLQLTIAWDKISTDGSKGTAQKKSRFWERVVEKFVMLMYENQGIKPEDNVRNSGGCENRMTEIKAQCSRWTAARARAHAQNHSGWSAEDVEKLCHKLHEAEGKGPFKWEECWKALKGNPKWIDYCKRKSGRNNSNAGARVRTHATSSDAPVNESAPIDLTSDDMQNETPNTPIFVNTSSGTEVGGHSKDTCTPNLEGPASIDVDRPPGTKKAKVSNQRQRRIRQHSESQESVSKSLTAGMMSMESATSSRWKKIEDADRKRDLKEDERYNDTRRMHILEVGRERSELVYQREAIGEKLLAAIQKLDQIDPQSIVTSSQRLAYDIKKKAVEDFQEQHEVLGDLLMKTKNYNSPSSTPHENVVRSGISQKRLFEGDEDRLDHDY